MSASTRSARSLRGVAALLAIVLVPKVAQAETKQTPQALRASFSALMDSYQQVYEQEGDVRGVLMVDQARFALARVDDDKLSRMIAKGNLPDFAPATSAMKRLGKSSQKLLARSAELTAATAPAAAAAAFPSSPSVIDACVNTPHGDQITYDALIAFQVTSGILAAANYVCVESDLG